VSDFEIKVKWLNGADNAVTIELAATLARVQIYLGRKNITEYRSARSRDNDTALQIPTYYLAEWLAENWWVILFEPRKDEDSDDSEFVTRHSIIAAQHGFPLPALSIMPFGRSIRLNSAPRRAPYANIQFITGESIDAARDDVQDVLCRFLDETVERLHSGGVNNSDLALTWSEIKNLTPEEREFCELVGSLGLSPADATDALSQSLERIYDVLGGRATRDFCLAAKKDDVESSIRGAVSVAQYLPNAGDTKLTPLMDARLPPENYSRPSWLRGMQAAKNLREKLLINARDPMGADKIFDRLGIDPTQSVHLPDVNNIQLPFSGAIERHDNTAKIALLQQDVMHRRFGAGRSTYLAWVSEHESRRLVTNAVTRDQQASRSFAAEILIPQAYLTRLAGSTRELHYDQVREVARERRIMPDVARKQAYNAGIRVGEI
jgi:hypothetical protein